MSSFFRKKPGEQWFSRRTSGHFLQHILIVLLEAQVISVFDDMTEGLRIGPLGIPVGNGLGNGPVGLKAVFVK